MTTWADPIPYRCAAVCVFGNGLVDPEAMRCHHPQGGRAGAPMLLTEMRKTGMPCGPEAALMTFHTPRREAPITSTQYTKV
jgi:hypothetical protein